MTSSSPAGGQRLLKISATVTTNTAGYYSEVFITSSGLQMLEHRAELRSLACFFSSLDAGLSFVGFFFFCIFCIFICFSFIFNFSFLHSIAYLNSQSEWLFSPRSHHWFYMLIGPKRLWQWPSSANGLESQTLTALPWRCLTVDHRPGVQWSQTQIHLDEYIS